MATRCIYFPAESNGVYSRVSVCVHTHTIEYTYCTLAVQRQSVYVYMQAPFHLYI